MGYALAEHIANSGGFVYLISGPSSLKISHQNIELINVVSAQEMYEAAINIFSKADITILSAAVADYRPTKKSNEKIKKTDTTFSIGLTQTKDIAYELGKLKKNKQVLVGFALETQNEIENAKKKIIKKNLDLIVLNSLKDEGAGFKHDTNKISVITKNNNIVDFKLKHKNEVAKDIVESIIDYVEFQ